LLVLDLTCEKANSSPGTALVAPAILSRCHSIVRMYRSGLSIGWDGRVVYLGGDHEDSYDPDFCIYNDVVVFGPKTELRCMDIQKRFSCRSTFTRPLSSATESSSLVVWATQTLAAWAIHRYMSLTCQVFALPRSRPRGRCQAGSSSTVRNSNREVLSSIRGGELIEERGGGQRYRRNVEDYALDVGSGVWRRLTNRNWRQFSIRQEDDGLFIQERRLSPENLVPRNTMRAVVAEEKWNRAQILVKGIPVSIIVGVHDIEVIIEGDLPSEISVQVAEQVRVNAEAAIKRPCVVEEK
jgi:hypothetical protein